jgi:hypothetical protein
MKRILILSMSCNDDFFISQEEDVKNTWAKDIIEGKYENIDFMIYRGGYDENSMSKKNHLMKLNVYDDINNTFLKTYMALSMCWKYLGKYDYVFRTNTSTYINIPLLNELVQNLDSDDIVYGSDIYSLSEKNCPYPLCWYVRGNGMLLSQKHIDIILEDSLPLLYQKGGDDTMISSILNSYYIKNGEDYKKHIRGYKHGWYKTTNTDVNNGNNLCKYNCDNNNPEFWNSFITIQMKSYMDRNIDHKNYLEFYEIMKSYVDKDINKTALENINYEFQLFIGSILGYVNHDEWINTDKYKLYLVEVNHKASDDDARFLPKEPLKYVNYYKADSKILI